MKMYIRLITTVAGVLALTGASTVNAQDTDLKVRVPFEFMVGDANLPRDVYTVSRLEGHSDVLLVRSERRGAIMIGQAASGDPAGNPELVFHRYGSQYFLREIRFSKTFGVSLPQPRGERTAADQRASRGGAAVETVIVTGQRE